MAGTFDDIIRRILGVHQPMPDESQPFRGSPLGPMIEDYLEQEPQRPTTMLEGQMPPSDKWRDMTEALLGQSSKMPFIPSQTFAKPGPIPSDMMDVPNPRSPLERGNSRTGSGLDV